MPVRFDFRGGRVSPELLPQSELRRTWSRVVGERLEDLANARDPFGWGPLREEVALAATP